MKRPMAPRTHWPLIGILASAGLFISAAAYYPGGTTGSINSVGYDWTRDFISTLFAATALNGSANPARYLAIPAMLMLCISLGCIFKAISVKARLKSHRKTIEIAGIGSMVYAFLAVTPLHNVMVSLALTLFVTAMFVILHVLHVERKRRLLFSGLLSLALLLVSAAIYYGNVLHDLLPISQKVTFIVCSGWLIAVHYSKLGSEAATNAAPNQSMAPTR